MRVASVCVNVFDSAGLIEIKKAEHRSSTELMSFVNKVNTGQKMLSYGYCCQFDVKNFIRSVFRNIECDIYYEIVHCHVTL